MTTFQVTKDGKKIELTFVEPTPEVLTEAQKKHSKTFASMLADGGLLRKKLTQYLREQGLWDDDKQKELEKLNKAIADKEHKLHKGGIKLSAARKLALDIKHDRERQNELLSAYNEYDNNTIEGQADNARFNYLVYACTVYNDTKERYFDSYEKFASWSDPVALTAAAKYAKEFYGLGDFQSSLPENKFLREYKFVNEDLRLIDDKGRLIDEKGNLIDELGNKVDSKGNIIDDYGYKRTKEGSFADKPSPFLDDDGNPIVVDSNEDSTETK